MKRLSVKSSTIKSIGYNYSFKELEVEFIRGAIYRYQDVDSNVVCNLLFAESIGQYFNKNVAKNFKYEKVEDK